MQQGARTYQVDRQHGNSHTDIWNYSSGAGFGPRLSNPIFYEEKDDR